MKDVWRLLGCHAVLVGTPFLLLLLDVPRESVLWTIAWWGGGIALLLVYINIFLMGSSLDDVQAPPKKTSVPKCHKGLGMVVVLTLLFGHVTASHAGALGIPLDGFLTSWQTWVIGLGIILFVTGLAGWAGEKFNTPYQPMLAGTMGLFTTAGLLGGGLTIAGLLGLVGGATL